MAFPLARLVQEVIPDAPQASVLLVKIMDANGIVDAINFAMLDDEDLESVCGDNADVLGLARNVLLRAKDLIEGWSKLGGL